MEVDARSQCLPIKSQTSTTFFKHLPFLTGCIDYSSFFTPFYPKNIKVWLTDLFGVTMRVPPHSASVNIRKQVWYPPALAQCQEYSEFPYKIRVTASHVAPPPLVAPRRPCGTSSGAGIFEFGALRGPRRAGGGRERHRRARLPRGDVAAGFGRRRRRSRVDVRPHPHAAPAPGGGRRGLFFGPLRGRPAT